MAALGIGLGAPMGTRAIGFDADALEFFNRAGGMTTAAKVRHNRLVRRLKGFGLWGNVRTIYGADGGVIRDIGANTPTVNNEGARRWLNRKANSLHLDQTTVTAQPLFKEIGFSGMPSLYFDGDDDSMQLSSMTTTCRKTVFVVASHTGGGAGVGNCLFSYTYDWTNKNQASYQERISTTRSDIVQNDISPYDNSSAVWRVGAGQGVALNTPTIATVTFGHSRNEMSLRRNQIDILLDNGTPATTFTDIASRITLFQIGYRGTGTQMMGHISFLMTIDGLITTEQRSALESLIGGWYGL